MKKRLKTFIILSLVLFITATNTSSFGQNTQDEPFIASSDSSGEETIRELEQIAIKAKESGERLFVIARPSKREKSSRISSSRLSYTRTFLNFMRQFPFQNAVFAKGDPIDGEGRIEFYLGSHLQLVTLAKLNKIPNLTCCPDHTPPVKRKLRSKN